MARISKLSQLIQQDQVTSKCWDDCNNNAIFSHCWIKTRLSDGEHIVQTLAISNKNNIFIFQFSALQRPHIMTEKNPVPATSCSPRAHVRVIYIEWFTKSGKDPEKGWDQRSLPRSVLASRAGGWAVLLNKQALPVITSFEDTQSASSVTDHWGCWPLGLRVQEG